MNSKDTINMDLEESSLIKSKNKIKKLKSDYFLVKLFSFMRRGISLKVVKYNHNIQKRLNIDINTYKEYTEIYSPIEIEIIPTKNEIGDFINIDEENKNFFHIYFNDNKEKEIERTKLYPEDKVSKINVIIDYQIKSFSKLFQYCDCVESINFKKFYRNNIDDMSSMFYGCTVAKLDLSNFNTNNVTNMSKMFGLCSYLSELNLSNFNTNKVTDMSFMFNESSFLKELNLSNFNTDNVTNMRGMFSSCSALRELNISSFRTNNVTDMSEMFYNCSSLNELNISNFNTNKVANMSSMFSRCSGLRMLNVSNFNTNNVTDMSYMFFNCLRLQDLNLDNFNTNNVTDMSNMFEYCTDEFQKKIKSKYNNLKDEAFRV